MAGDSRTRWLALIVLCLGSLMIVLDATIVNVALPSIRADLGFTEASLAWVVNAYLLTFGGFLLLGGRLGDIYGHRLMFLAGIVLFTRRVARLRRRGARRRCSSSRGPCRGSGARSCPPFAVADHDAVHRAGRPREGDGRVRLRRVGRRHARRAARRRADRRPQLALDLPRQHPDRDRRLPALPALAADEHRRGGDREARRRGRRHRRPRR